MTDKNIMYADEEKLSNEIKKLTNELNNKRHQLTILQDKNAQDSILKNMDKVVSIQDLISGNNNLHHMDVIRRLRQYIEDNGFTCVRFMGLRTLKNLRGVLCVDDTIIMQCEFPRFITDTMHTFNKYEILGGSNINSFVKKDGKWMVMSHKIDEDESEAKVVTEPFENVHEAIREMIDYLFYAG